MSQSNKSYVKENHENNVINYINIFRKQKLYLILLRLYCINNNIFFKTRLSCIIKYTSINNFDA